MTESLPHLIKYNYLQNDWQAKVGKDELKTGRASGQVDQLGILTPRIRIETAV